MRLEIDIAEHHYNNIMALDSVSLGRVPYKGIIMYSINAIKHGKVLEQEPRKGEWQLTDDEMFVYCPFCQQTDYPRPIDASWKYCPECGARLD